MIHILLCGCVCARVWVCVFVFMTGCVYVYATVYMYIRVCRKQEGCSANDPLLQLQSPCKDQLLQKCRKSFQHKIDRDYGPLGA